MGVGQITMDSSEESLHFKAVFFILSKAEIGIIEVLIKFPANLIIHDHFMNQMPGSWYVRLDKTHYTF